MIDDMAVYIANLGKYNEGYLVGAWFTFPIDEEDVKEKIGLNEQYEEYAIHDTDNFPIAIGEYVSIEELNSMYEMIEELPDYIVECLDEFISHYGTLEEVVEHKDDIYYYPDCETMTDVLLDPKSERGNWKETLPEIAHEINIVNLTSDKDNAGLLDPFVIMKNVKDAESLAIDILTFLTGISSRDGEKFPVLRKAVRSVTQSDSRGLLHVIDELRREDTPISRNIADHIDSFTDYDFAHLLFSDGTVENAISLDNQLNIIQVADLVLPDKDTTFEEYTTIELLSVSMLIVISTFALDFIHSDRSIFKIVDLDEAWAFLNVAQGETLSNKLVRAGRAMQAGVYFVTQSSGDVAKESLKNNIGLKFAFRSTDINEIKQTLEFFGIDKDDENNQKRLRDLENGQCLLQDLYGRVGVVQIHPVFEELLHAFDTRPPVQRNEVE
ncbi:conjugal transfer protein [Blautia wexlerae]|nr:conjugal transfer protein [Blautia wexlerae]